MLKIGPKIRKFQLKLSVVYAGCTCQVSKSWKHVNTFWIDLFLVQHGMSQYFQLVVCYVQVISVLSSPHSVCDKFMSNSL